MALDKFHDYRQTMYHDGAGLRIAESRRRSGMVRKVEPSAQAYVDFVLYPANDAETSLRSHPDEVEQHHPASRAATGESRSRSHVTFAKRSSKIRAKPVIVHGIAKSTETLSDKTKASLQTSADPTPPPTPRPARLSTPDLSELDEAPFCDCGFEPHVVKRCATCGKTVDLWSM
ncbi:hypothetical protein BDW02DRAFT_495117 [Decorospora gaudefroyi]|uniref:Uncharacterized protein n=1 Tax=Decorospora gaudefroyi TaxID=184978 RepID=A0A6A5KIV1_9PLEO|nr:hypothetical protein BDW02DRAFT_495117 [Decorospora gaudefroyi]